MDENLPPTNRAVLVLFEGLALAMAFGAEENWRAGHSAWASGAECIASLCLSYIGFKWSWLRSTLVSRLPWIRLKRELQAAREEIEELKQQPRPSLVASSSMVSEAADLKIQY